MGRVGWCRPGVDVATEARKISARGPARPSDAARTLVHHPPHGAKKLRDCDTRESRFPANLHLIRGGVVPRTNVVRGRISRERNSIQMTTVMNVGASTATDARTAGQEAARAIMDGIGDCAPQLCILLASASYDLHAVLEEIRKVTGDTPLMGCSTSSQFTRAGVTERGVSLALIASDEMEVKLTSVEGWAATPTESVTTALKSLNGSQRRSDTLDRRGRTLMLSRWSSWGDRVPRRAVQPSSIHELPDLWFRRRGRHHL